MLDFDGDGHEELWIHSDAFSAIVALSRGGALEDYTLFAAGINHANALTRRRESYHDEALERGSADGWLTDGGTASIHDIEAGIRLDTRPAVDAEDRALLVERVVPPDLTLDQWSGGGYRSIVTWASARAEHAVRRRGSALEVTMTLGSGRQRLTKVLRFARDGRVEARFEWSPEIAGADDRFTTELSVFGTLTAIASPEAEWWRYPIETVAKSERGLDRTRQGESITLRWPARLGAAAVTLPG